MRYGTFVAAMLVAATASAADAVVVTYDMVIDLGTAKQSGKLTVVNLPADTISLLPGDTLQGTVTFTGGDIVTLTNNTTSPAQWELVQLAFTPKPSVYTVTQGTSDMSFTGVTGKYTGASDVATTTSTNLTAQAFADLTTTSFSFTGFTYSLVYQKGTATAFTPSQLTMGYTVGISAPASVPEPATWALLVGGFGGVGTALRRRRGMAPRVLRLR